MKFSGRRITDSAKKRISQKAKDAEQKLKKTKSKESFWVVRKLKELWQKVTQPHVLKAAAASMITAVVSAAIVAIKSRMKAKQELDRAEREHQAVVIDLTENLRDRNERLGEVERDIRRVRGDNELLRQQATEREDAIRRIENDRTRLEERLQNANRDLTNARNRLVQSENERMTAVRESRDLAESVNGRRVRELESEVSELRRELLDNSQEGTALREQLDDLERRVIHAISSEDQLRASANRLRAEVRRLATNEEEEVRRILTIHQRRIETQQEIDAYNHTIRTLDPEGERIRQEMRQEANNPARAAGVDPRSAEFAEAGRYNGIANESITPNSGTAHSNIFAENSNRFQSMFGRNRGAAGSNVRRAAFANRVRKAGGVNTLIERARANNMPRGTNVFNERNNRYSSLELDSAYALWLNQFDF